MYSYGPPHMAGQKQNDQFEHTFSSYVRIWDVTLKTWQRWWMIGKSSERGSGISVLVAQHDDDDGVLWIIFKLIYLIHRSKQVLPQEWTWAMKEYCTVPKSSELEPHLLMQFSIIHKIPLFAKVLPFCRGYNQYIKSPADRAEWDHCSFVLVLQRKCSSPTDTV